MAIKDLIGMSERLAEGRSDSTGSRSFRVPRTVAPATSIDATTTLTGKLRCKDTLRIDGRLMGELACDKNVIIGEAAVVEASIVAEEVIVFGQIKGDVTAKRKITLESSARVAGDLATPGIVIEEGAKLTGRIVIGVEATVADAKQPAAKPAQKAAAAPARAATPARPAAATPPPA
jgi:cytoskeletal protein CcmA (bactofilin family)